MRTTDPDYKPKHKKPQAWAGSTPRGPERWARAAHNALVNPTSEAAKLYRKRVNLAAGAAETFEPVKEPIAFLKPARSHWHPETKTTSYTYTDQVEYYTCSIYCATMQAQLDRSFRKPPVTNMVGLLLRSGDLVLRRPTRTVRCQGCGKAIRP